MAGSEHFLLFSQYFLLIKFLSAVSILLSILFSQQIWLKGLSGMNSHLIGMKVCNKINALLKF